MIEEAVSSDNPYISVVIPTIPSNSHETVVDLLEKQQFSHQYEVIVVNDSSLDICEARNKGIKEASASIVCLTDDDCEPPLDWLESIYQAFQENKELVAVEGPVKGGINYSGYRRYVGCNLAFNREIALEVMFDSAFAGWRDDTEFGWRMEERGDCTYDEGVLMIHPPRPGSGFISENEKRLEDRHPEKYTEIFVRNASIVDRIHRKLNTWGAIEVLNKIRYSR